MISGGGVVEAAQRGDVFAFSSLVERYQTPVYRYLYRLTANTDLARRLTLSTFVSAERQLKKLDRAMRFEAWLYRIATGTARAALRWRRPAQRLSVEDDQDAQAVQAALASLPFSSAAALLLYSLGGFSYDEIGQILRVSTRDVRRHLAAARQRLRTAGTPLHDAAQTATCRPVRPLLSAHYDHQTGSEERAAIEAHLAACAECRAELAAYEELGRSLARMKARGPSVSITQDVLRTLRGEKLDVTVAPRPGRRRAVLLGGVAIVLLASCSVGTFLLVRRAEQPPPGGDGLLYVTLHGGSPRLAIVDVESARLVATIPLAVEPIGLVATRDGRRVYVLDDNAVISVVDAAEQAVGARYQLPGRPGAMGLSRDENSLFVTLSDRRSLITVDAATGRQTAEVRVGRTPREVVVSPDGQGILVFNAGDSSISKIKAGARQEASVIRLQRLNESATAFNTHPMAFSPDGRTLYIAELNRERIWTLNLSNNKLEAHAVPLRDLGRDILVAPAGDRLYVSHGDPRGSLSAQAGLALVSLPGVERKAEIRGYYHGVALSADGATLFAANPDDSVVIFADALTLQTLATAPLGQRPALLIYAPRPR